MKTARFMRFFLLVGSGAMMFQSTGCVDPLNTANDIIQTIFLGITAAGAIAILQNV